MENAQNNIDGVTVNIFRNTRKDQKDYCGSVTVDGKTLPFVVYGISTDDTRTKALTFYRDELLNTIHDYSFVDSKGDDMEAQKRMVNAFLIPVEPEVVEVPELPKVEVTPVVSDLPIMYTAKGTPDLRYERGVTAWYHHKEMKKREKIRKDKIPEYVANGWEEGRDWEKKGKPKVDRRAPDYKNPLKDYLWVNNGVKRFRVAPSRLQEFLDQGYEQKRGNFVAVNEASPDTLLENMEPESVIPNAPPSDPESDATWARLDAEMTAPVENKAKENTSEDALVSDEEAKTETVE